MTMLESVKEALRMEFRRKEDPDDVWHELKQLKQRESQSVAGYTALLDKMVCSTWNPVSSHGGEEEAIHCRLKSKFVG